MSLMDVPRVPVLGSEAQLAAVMELTNDRLLPPDGAAAPLTAQERMAPDPWTPTVGVREWLDDWRLARLADIMRWYVLSTPKVVAAAAASALILGPVVLASRRWSPLLAVAAVLFTALAARLGLLAYMDATAFPMALDPVYMLPMYPLMYAISLLILIDTLGWLWRLKR
jgi:hypothetical protein